MKAPVTLIFGTSRSSATLTLCGIAFLLSACISGPPRAGPPPGHTAVSADLPPPALRISAAPTDLPTPAPTLPAPEGVVTFLLLGVDQRPDESAEPPRTDAIMLLRVDFDNQNAGLLSFPRDLWIPLADLNYYDIYYGRINTAYYYGEKYGMPGGGAEILRRTILLDFGIPIDHYLLINFGGFVGAVDAVGGIDVEVPKAIYDPFFPTDDYGTTLFELDAGPQHMDGLTALRYARTRRQDSDTERVKRQQAVLVGMAAALLQTDTPGDIRALYSALAGAYETDLTLADMLWYAGNAGGMSTDRLRTYAIDQTMLVPHVTAGGAHVWLPKPERIDALMWEFAARAPDQKRPRAGQSAGVWQN